MSASRAQVRRTIARSAWISASIKREGETICFRAAATPLDASGDGPKWNVVIPMGEYHGPTLAPLGGKFTFTAEFFNTLVANWKANGSFRIPVRWGHEHETNDDPAKAKDLDRKAANLVDLRVSSAGLEGLTDWKDTGRKDVQAGEFDSWSAEFRMRHLNRLTGEVGGPLLTGVGLTNDPFFNLMPPVAASAHAMTDAMTDAAKWLTAAIARHERHMSGAEATSQESQMKMMDEMRKALSALEEMPPVAAAATASTDTNPNQEQQMNPEQLKKWALSLGLSADATAEQCISACNARVTAAEARVSAANVAVPAEVITAAVKPVLEQVEALKVSLKAEQDKGLERDVDAAIELGKRGDGKTGRAITPDLRGFIMATAKGAGGLESAKKLIDALPLSVPIKAIGFDTKHEEGAVSASAANDKLNAVANELQAKGDKDPMVTAMKLHPDLAKAARSLSTTVVKSN